MLKYKAKLRESVAQNRVAKRDYERRLPNDVRSNSKSFLAYVRSKQRTKDRVGPLKNIEGNVVVDDGEAASLLNVYFGSVFTIEDRTEIPRPASIFQGKVDEGGLLNLKIDSRIVEKKLQSLKIDKSPGLDGIHQEILFQLRKEISEPLSNLFNHSLQGGRVPIDRKEAGVTALFKKGKKSDVQNYRPVSLTRVVCKIMKSILKDAILVHLEKHKLIRNSQHGFTRGKSCLTNLLEFFEAVTSNLDEGKPVDIIYLDFSKAFDTRATSATFSNIQAHGIGGKILEWVKNWVADRRQKVGVNGTYSGWESVIDVVPQGSVLGH